jgi:hypothetical protein
MKTLSLLAAAAALSLGLAAGTPVGAATYKPNPGGLAAIKYLACQTLLNTQQGVVSQSVRVWNNSGVMLKAGTAIHINYTWKGKPMKATRYLAQNLPNGSSVQLVVGPYDFVAGCTAQVNLLAGPGMKLPKPPVEFPPGRNPPPY